MAKALGKKYFARTEAYPAESSARENINAGWFQAAPRLWMRKKDRTHDAWPHLKPLVLPAFSHHRLMIDDFIQQIENCALVKQRRSNFWVRFHDWPGYYLQLSVFPTIHNRPCAKKNEIVHVCMWHVNAIIACRPFYFIAYFIAFRNYFPLKINKFPSFFR